MSITEAPSANLHSCANDAPDMPGAKTAPSSTARRLDARAGIATAWQRSRDRLPDEPFKVHNFERWEGWGSREGAGQQDQKNGRAGCTPATARLSGDSVLRAA